MKTRTSLLACGIAAGLMTLSSAALAEIKPTPGAGNMVGMLATDAQMYTDAMARMLVKDGTRVNSRLANQLSGRALKPTVARVEYTYNDGRTEVTRTYHARSGNSIADVIEECKKAASGSSSSCSGVSASASASEYSSDAGDLSRARAASAEEIARDTAETEFYPPDTEFDVRVAKLPEEGSAVEWSEIGDGKSHAWDAELKIYRRIDADIANGVVRPGGRVVGYVSQTVCESCNTAIQAFSERNGIDGTMYFLQKSEPLPGVVEPELTVQSRAGNTALYKARVQYNNRAFKRPLSVSPTAQWDRVSDEARLIAAEALETSEASEAVVSTEVTEEGELAVTAACAE